MDWLKIEKSTPEKPEITLIAADLGLSTADVFLLCFRLWAWADSHTSTGMVPGFGPAAVDSLLGVAGFASALQKVGWLRFDTEGRQTVLSFPNFDRHMSSSAKARAQSSRRQALRRSRSRHAEGATPSSLLFSSSSHLPPEEEKESVSARAESVSARAESVSARAESVSARAETLEFEQSPEGLAQAFVFYQRPNRNRLEEVVEVFAELMRLGAPPHGILEEIKRKTRRKSEYLWQFEKRILETGGYESQKKTGSGSRVQPTADAIAIVAKKIRN